MAMVQLHFQPIWFNNNAAYLENQLAEQTLLAHQLELETGICKHIEQMQDKAIQESDAAPETKMLVEAQEMNLATAKNILKDKQRTIKTEKAEIKLQQEKIANLKDKIK